MNAEQAAMLSKKSYSRPEVSNLFYDVLCQILSAADIGKRSIRPFSWWKRLFISNDKWDALTEDLQRLGYRVEHVICLDVGVKTSIIEKIHW